MTRWTAALAAVTLACGLTFTTSAHAQPAPPTLTGPVNDFAGIIDADSTRALEELSNRLLKASGDVLVVATVKSYQPYADLPSYAVKMFENGGKGIGANGDNGLLIVMAVDERQVRIEVGYGLEGIITDGFAGETSRDTMVPYFRRGDYGGGLLAGAARVAERIAADRNVDLGAVSTRQPGPSRRTGSGGFPIGLIILIIIVLLNLFGGGRRRRRRRMSPFWISGVGGFGNHNRWGGGGGWGGGSGGFGGGFGGFGGGRSGGGGGGAGW